MFDVSNEPEVPETKKDSPKSAAKRRTQSLSALKDKDEPRRAGKVGSISFFPSEVRKFINAANLYYNQQKNSKRQKSKNNLSEKVQTVKILTRLVKVWLIV